MVPGFKHYLMLGLSVVLLISSVAYSAECTLISETCTEANKTKNIEGVDVFRECWSYVNEYECEVPGVDACVPLLSEGCWQLSATCTTFNTDGSCIVQEKVFRCENHPSQSYPDTTFLSTYYEITQDILIDGCASQAINPYCVLNTDICVETGETRNINGLDVYKDCWRWTDDYSCTSTEIYSTCTDYANDPDCTLASSNCDDTDEITGACILTTKEYDCIEGYTDAVQVVDCGGNVFCLDGTGACFDASYSNDQDFANAVTMLEMAREAGIYMDPDSLTIFNGTAESCRHTFFGLSDCCESNSSGVTMSNQSYAGNMISQVATGIVVEGVEYAGYVAGVQNLVGSYYTFDALFMSDAPNWMVNGVENTFGQFGVSNTYTFDLSVSVYGFTGTFGAMPTTTLGVSNVALGSTTVAGSPVNFYFSPAMFAVAVAVMVVQELMACEPEEQELGFKQGADLCHYVGKWCSEKFLGTCYEESEGHCCFNSKLARIIQEQGREQIGKSWGSAQTPDCSGFSVEELGSLDFSQMDFAEFIDDIVANQVDSAVASDVVGADGQSILDDMGEKYENYYNN